MSIDVLGAIKAHAVSARPVWWTLAASAVALLCAIGTNAVATRVLGPASFGHFAFAVTLLTTLGTMMGLGLPAALVRFTRSGGEYSKHNIEHFLWGAAVFAGTSIALIYVGVDALTTLFEVPTVGLHAGIMIALAGVGVSMSQMAAADAQLHLNFRRYFAVMGGGSGLRFLLPASCLLIRPTLTAAVAAVTLSWVISGLGWAWTRMQSLGLGPVVSALRHGQLRRDVSQFAGPILGSTLVVAATQSVDIIVAANLLTPSSTGIYAAGVRLLVAQSTIIAALTNAALPYAVRAVEEERQQQVLRRIVVNGSILSLSCTSALVVISPLVVSFLYGAPFAAAAAVFAILTCGVALNFVANPASQLLIAMGQPHRLFVVHVGQLLLFIAGLPLAASYWDFLGIAVWRATTNTLAAALILQHTFTTVRAFRKGKN